MGTSTVKSGQHRESRPDAHGLARASHNAAGGRAGRRACVLETGPVGSALRGDGTELFCTWLQRCTRVSPLTWLYLEDCVLLSINYSAKLMHEKYIKIGILLFITHTIASSHI